MPASAPIRRDIRLRFGGEPRLNGKREAKGNEVTKHIFAFAAEVNAALHFLFAHLEIAKFERAYDLPERLRAQLSYFGDIEDLRNVVEKTFPAHARQVVEMILAD
jgi:hypothetical protein